ncbi:MAG: hypothetical protein JXB10_03745, partial [Pirellulales bacterium]|nr:hypothetical protein [Pirellulales bacterium]
MSPILQKILANRSLFSRQGAVVASWRYKNGVKIGPYYRLAYRHDGRQCSLYLGRSEELVQEVQQLLAQLQRPLRQRKAVDSLRKRVNDLLRRNQADLRAELAARGLSLRGFRIIGWQRLRQECFERQILPRLATNSLPPV